MRQNGENMKKWYWIELIGFDNTASDFGVQSFLERTSTEVEGISILFSNMDSLIGHESVSYEKKLRPCDCTYGGYLHGEERDRQEWTNFQLQGLIKELHRHGVKVMYSVFDFCSYTSDDGKTVKDSKFFNKHKELFYLEANGAPSKRDVCLIKRLSDGQYFEDILIEKFREFTRYYDFDGIQVADGISSYRPALQRADMGDDLVSQFSSDTGISNENLNPVGNSRTAYKARRKYIIENLYFEWIKWNASRWARFYEKFYSAFSGENRLLYFNSAWTRDPFEAFLRYGIDYKTTMYKADAIMDEWAIPANISSVESKDGVYLPEDKMQDYLNEFMLTQQSIKAYLPEIKQYTMSAIKDTFEQWEIMNVAPMEQESAFFHRNNNFVFDGERFVNASDGPWYCLSSGMSKYDWARLNKMESVSRIEEISGTLGFLNVWGDCIEAEAEKYLKTHNYSQSQLKYELFAAGLSIGGAVRAEDVQKVSSPLLVTNPTSLSDSDVLSLEKCSLPMVIIGGENNISGAEQVFSGSYISVWVKNIKADTALFDGLKKFDKPKKCKGGSYIDFGGLWTCPLRYNTLPKKFFKELAKILNGVFEAPAGLDGISTSSIVTFKTGEKKHRILVRTPSHCYYLAKIRMPFKIKSAVVLNKSANHAIGVKDNVLGEVVCPRGTSIIEVVAE